MVALWHAITPTGHVRIVLSLINPCIFFMSYIVIESYQEEGFTLIEIFQNQHIQIYHQQDMLLVSQQDSLPFHMQ